MIPITEKNLKEILYHLNSFMRLMGYGKEYNKIIDLIRELPLSEMDLTEYPQINMIINPSKRYNIIVK